MNNPTIFQFFHWYYSPEGNLWKHGKEEAARLASLGVTDVWLPPAYKSAKGIEEPGYAVYDLYDLGAPIYAHLRGTEPEIKKQTERVLAQRATSAE